MRGFGADGVLRRTGKFRWLVCLMSRESAMVRAVFCILVWRVDHDSLFALNLFLKGVSVQKEF
jgi:hypothetical protein